jgi:flagellar basal-body rod protein FlgB
MDPTRTGPLLLAEMRMRWLEARQRVLAQNMANADTPGYRARDLRPFAEALAAARPAAGMVRTDARHLPPTREVDPRVQRERRPPERSLDGNSVALDREALRIAETETAHALALTLYRRYIGMFRTALGRIG